MISKQVMQSTIEGLAAIAQVELRVMDADGRPVAFSDPEASLSAEESRAVEDFAGSSADAQEIRGAWYFKIYNGDQTAYILVVIGNGENTHTMGRMAAFQLTSLTVAYRDRFDKDGFFKNLLLDNLLLVDIYSRAKKLHIDEDTERVCLVIRFPAERDAGAIDVVRNATDGARDIVTEIDETDIILVRDLPEREAHGENPEESDAEAETQQMAALREYATSLLKKLDKKGYKELRISCGTVVHDLKDVSRSYKEAKMALDVGQIFYENVSVICYGELGIGRLIYQLPLPLCRMFLRETFGSCVPGEDIDQETIETVRIFFENSLNVSETARMLFIHRNSLVYRLDKLQKITGLDVRIFEDAMTYCIAMMVVKYMKYMEEG